MNMKEFYKKVFILVLPMALQNLINVGVTSSDVVMLGKVGEKVLSGASLGGQIYFIMTLIFFGLTSGASVLTSQYWGKQDTDTIEKILGLALRISITVSLVFTVAAFVFPQYLMRIFSSDPEVIRQGAMYLRIVCLSYVPASVTMVYLNVMRSIERVTVSTIVYFVSFLANIILNAIFIFGLFGCPAMGVRGAALGTVLARCMELCMVIYYNARRNKVVQFRFRYWLKTEKWLVKDFLSFSLPVVMNELFWGLGTSANAAILGHLGSAVTAANSVTQVIRQLAMVVCFGLANATAILIGKSIGEGNMEQAKEYGRRFKNLSIALGCAGSAVVLMIRPFAMNFVSVSEESVRYMGIMLFIMAYYVIAQAFNTTMVVGIFRAGGDTRFGLILDVSTMWCGSIILGFVAAFILKWNLTAVYMIVMCDEIIKVPLCIWRYRSYKWLKDVTR
ncbi:MAG: MATE family efflux transporter [Thermoflexaceae bacterium]|nr:MATE family efflux transporter [Thermoflexaceae bacterium]